MICHPFPCMPSPEPRIRSANRYFHNSALCRLAAACPQGERLSFYHARTDNWERSRLFPDGVVLIAEEHEQIVGAATVAFKKMWLLGETQPVAYFFDRMVHSDYRRRGIARQLVQRQLERAADTRLRYCLVLEDNYGNRAVLEKEGFQVHPSRLMYFAILPAVFSKPRASVQLYEPIPDGTGHFFDDTFRQRFALADVTSTSGDGLFEIEWQGERAAAVYYAHGAKVFVHAPWYLRWLGCLLPVVPRLHQPIRTWSLCHIWYEGVGALKELLAGVARAANDARVAVVLLPLYENDPRIDELRPLTLNRWGISPTNVCLYLHGDAVPELLATALPILASGRDG